MKELTLTMTPRLHTVLTTLCAALALALPARAVNVCSNPGKDGPGAPSGVVNSYYPGLSVSAGSTSVPVGAIDTSTGGSATAIAAGDLVLVMQMQDADISSANSSAYGGSSPGSGDTALNNSGVYEYASVAANYAGGSPILLTAPLKNSYRRSASVAGSSGQRTFQVIRVPQYGAATLAGTVTAAAWNGSTGGVAAFDVAGQLNWNSQIIDVTGRGFRGGAGLWLTGAGASQTLAVTDYAATLSPTVPTISPNPSSTSGPFPGAHGSKGEGIAGTPRYVFIPATYGVATNAAGAVLDTGVEGYPGGSLARGAPGNAGGGGTDGNPTANDQNTGGGGGGGYAAGGLGGYGWTPGTPPGSRTGGFGGEGVLLSAARLTLGGGGGAGTSNNATGTPGYGLSSSGAPGGGVVLVRAKAITGTGTINANGAAGNQSVCNDASGGGGGGGAVLVFASGNSGNVGSLTINASGGMGGSNTGSGTGDNNGTCGAYNNNPHGPGGGGGGGFAALSSSSSAVINVSGSSGGTTSGSATSTPPYGSSASPGGYQISSVAATDLPGAMPSSLCYPLFTTSKTTSKPSTVQGSNTSYTITVSNPAGQGTATSVTLSDVLPAPFTFASTGAIALSGGAARTSAVNPAAGATAPAWGAFSIPGGGAVALSFTANVPAATPLATYQNPANVTYDDPTRSAAGQTVTPGGTYASGDFVLGSNYSAASSTQEDVTVLRPATLAKSFNPPGINPGGSSVLSIAVTNPNATALTAAAFSDAFPSGLTAAGGGVTVAGAGCTGFTPTTVSAGATLFAQSGGTVPASAACIFSISVTATTSASYLNTLPAGALTSAQGVTNTAAASATLLGRATIAKAFSPAAVPANTDATLAFTLTNPNAAQSLSGLAFTDSFPGGLIATGGAVTVGGTGCTGFLPTTVAANATAFNLTAGTVPAGGACTVSLAVRSASQGGFVNSTSGVSATETGGAGSPGPVSNTARLGVGVIGVSKSIAPAQIQSGGTALVTLALTNPTGVAQTAGALTDTLAGMAVGATAVGGTCTGTTPSTLTVGATSVSFTGISIPAAGCTVTFTVTSSTAGTQSNTSSGVTTALLPAGPASNTATLTVAAAPTIAKQFSPTVIQLGGSSTMTFTLLSGDSIPLTSASFSDVLNANLAVAGSGSVSAGGTCAGASGSNFTAGTFGATLTFAGLTVPTGAGGCTVTLPVTSNTLSTATGWPNRTSGVSSNEAPTGSGSATVNLLVAGAPVISKAFGTSPISQGGTSTLTFTLSSPSAFALTSGAFTDTLTNMQISAAGAATGTCAGAASNSFAAGQTALSFSGLTIPAAPGTCTVSVVVTSSSAGQNANTASGVTTAQTPGAGNPSNTATLTVDSPPQLSVGFSPGIILSSTALATSSSTLTITLTNPNSVALTGVAFTDALSNMTIYATGAAGGTCTGASGNSFTVGATALSFSGLTVPASGSCTVSVVVASANLSPAGGWPDQTSGATSAQTPTAGPASGTASLGVVTYATLAKSFSPNAIATNGVSTITLTLTNPNSINLNSASFSDTFPAGMTTSGAAQNLIGTGRGTCTGAIPSSLPATTAGTTGTIRGILLPANSSCTVLVDVTATAAGNYANTATGITTNETGSAAGPASNTATLGVGSLGLSKSFAPTTIGFVAGSADTTTLTFKVTNTSGGTASTIVFSDTFPAGMTIAAPLATTNSCGGTLRNTGNTANSAAGDPGLRLQAGSLANGANCQITVKVTVNATGSFSNTTGAVTWASGTGPASNTAVLTVVAKPSVAKAFAPTTVDTYRSSTMTLTLSNPNASAPLTSCSFTDALNAKLAVGGSGTVGASGTCAGANGNSFAAGTFGATLSFSGLTIPSAGSCTVTLPITSSTAGSYTNTTSGLLCGQLVTAGAASNSASVTYNKLPLQFLKSASLTNVPPGTAVTYTLTYTNPNSGMSLQGIVISDSTPRYTSFSSASCGVLPASLTGCTIAAPAVGGTGTVTWTLSGSLDPGATGSVTITVVVN